MRNKISLAPVTCLQPASLKVPEGEVEKINPAEMGQAKGRKRGKGDRGPRDPQAALLAQRKKLFGSVPAAHLDATEERKDRAVENEGMAFVDSQRIRRIADPLETLYRKKLLHRDPDQVKEHPMNAVLYQAGVRFRECHYGAGLEGVAAQDLTRTVVDGGAGHDSTSEYVTACWQKVRAVAEAAGPRLLPYLTGLVIEEKSVAKLAGSVTDTKSRVLSEAIAMERVREALHRAAEVFKLQPDERNRAIEACDGIGSPSRFEPKGARGRRAEGALARHSSLSIGAVA